MSDLTPKSPKTPEEKRARNTKIRHILFDMFAPAVAALFLVLAILWPHTIFTALSGISAGVVLIRFATSRYNRENGMSISDRLAMFGGITAILLGIARLILLVWEALHG